MNFANIELSKELYELSGWSDTTYWFNFDGHRAQKWEVGPSTMLNKPPAYDLGYLLRKLPNKITNRVNHWLEISPIRNNQWRAMYTNESLTQYADTPEDAAAKLAIELFKQGILTKEENDRV